MVRQAEVLAQIGVESGESINHGEQALTSVPPADVEPLLARLAKLTDAVPRIIEIYERQISRCKAPSDKLAALGRAAVVAASHGVFDKARSFFDVALGGAVQEETLNTLVAVARSSDSEQKTDNLRRTLAEALANGGQGSRDGGRTRGMLLGRAAELAHRELKDTEQAFAWLGDAIVSHVDDEPLAALEALADELGQPKRAETVLSRALEEVFDGPLVRKLLARRAAVRREKLSDPQGAAADLKRLHDLSPADGAVMDQLSALYVELDDYKGMVQLYEDQILRGKEPSARAELARKVARLWEEKLSDPREAADAWRRVLRMKAGDPEAAEGLDRAKANMLKRAPSDPPPEPAKPVAQPAKASPPAKPKSAAAKAEVEPESAEGETETRSETDTNGEPEAPAQEPPTPEPSADAGLTAPGEAEVRDAPTPEAAVDASSEPDSLAEAAPASDAASVLEPPSIPMPVSSGEPDDVAVTVSPPAEEAKASAEPAAEESEIPITIETAPEPGSEDRPSEPTSSRPSASRQPPPLPMSATPAAELDAVTNGSAPVAEADDPGRASAPPASAPAHRAPPPKPPGKKGGSAPASAPIGSLRPPPPPPRAGGAPLGSGRPPPPPTGASRAGGRPAPPPPGARGGGKPPLPPTGARAAAARPPSMSDEDELTVDEDELIDDKL
jgi:tetratricopeptide (TPR) repeat protein